MNCWTCKPDTKLVKCKGDLWACPKCQDEYWKCRLCKETEWADNVKGDNCSACGRFYCISCFQNDDNGEFCEEDIWQCSKCLE